MKGAFLQPGACKSALMYEVSSNNIICQTESQHGLKRRHKVKNLNVALLVSELAVALGTLVFDCGFCPWHILCTSFYCCLPLFCPVYLSSVLS